MNCVVRFVILIFIFIQTVSASSPQKDPPQIGGEALQKACTLLLERNDPRAIALIVQKVLEFDPNDINITEDAKNLAQAFIYKLKLLPPDEARAIQLEIRSLLKDARNQPHRQAGGQTRLESDARTTLSGPASGRTRSFMTQLGEAFSTILSSLDPAHLLEIDLRDPPAQPLIPPPIQVGGGQQMRRPAPPARKEYTDEELSALIGGDTTTIIPTTAGATTASAPSLNDLIKAVNTPEEVLFKKLGPAPLRQQTASLPEAAQKSIGGLETEVAKPAPTQQTLVNNNPLSNAIKQLKTVDVIPENGRPRISALTDSDALKLNLVRFTPNGEQTFTYYEQTSTVQTLSAQGVFEYLEWQDPEAVVKMIGLSTTSACGFTAVRIPLQNDLVAELYLPTQRSSVWDILRWLELKQELKNIETLFKPKALSIVVPAIETLAQNTQTGQQTTLQISREEQDSPKTEIVPTDNARIEVKIEFLKEFLIVVRKKDSNDSIKAIGRIYK